MKHYSFPLLLLLVTFFSPVLSKPRYPKLPNPYTIPNDDFLATEIVGGSQVPRGSMPWLAAIRYNVNIKPMGYGYCTGSLISNNPPMILTAGHCSQQNPSLFTIFVNRYDSTLSTLQEGGIEFSVSRVITHPQFNSDTLFNDLAVWVLQVKSNPLNIPLSSLQTITLNTNPSIPIDFSQVTIAGWGVTSYGSSQDSRFLLQASLNTVPNQSCVNLLGAKNVQPSTQVCLLYTGAPADTCQGDSGSAAFIYQNGKPLAIGITSWGNGCAKPNSPGVYIRISSFVPWIVSQIVANGGQAPNLPPPPISAVPTTTASPTPIITTTKTTSTTTSTKTTSTTSTKTTTTPPPPPAQNFQAWSSGCGYQIVNNAPCDPKQFTTRCFCISSTTVAWCDGKSRKWVLGVCKTGLSCGIRQNWDYDSWCWQNQLFSTQSNRYVMECPARKDSLYSPVKANLPVIPLLDSQKSAVKEKSSQLHSKK